MSLLRNVKEAQREPRAIDQLHLERETGIEPATNGLGSRYSTIELLPLSSQLYL